MSPDSVSPSSASPNPATDGSSPREVVIVKLGGSLLTDKKQEATARHETIERLAREVAEVRPELDEDLILGHGSGSFGHVAAARHGLGKGFYCTAGERANPDKGRGIAETLHEAARLHRLLVNALLQAGEAPFGWAPSSALLSEKGHPTTAGSLHPLVEALKLGLLPVVYGDVLLDGSWGASILSTERLIRHLIEGFPSAGLHVRRLLWCGETDGLYDDEGRTIEIVRADEASSVRQHARASSGTDVTGGMALRLETTLQLAQKGVESRLINGTVPGLLADALRGHDVPGTRILP